jgi:hypothetical protein
LVLAGSCQQRAGGGDVGEHLAFVGLGAGQGPSRGTRPWVVTRCTPPPARSTGSGTRSSRTRPSPPAPTVSPGSARTRPGWGRPATPHRSPPASPRLATEDRKAVHLVLVQSGHLLGGRRDSPRSQPCFTTPTKL